MDIRFTYYTVKTKVLTTCKYLIELIKPKYIGNYKEQDVLNVSNSSLIS